MVFGVYSSGIHFVSIGFFLLFFVPALIRRLQTRSNVSNEIKKKKRLFYSVVVSIVGLNCLTIKFYFTDYRDCYKINTAAGAYFKYKTNNAMILLKLPRFLGIVFKLFFFFPFFFTTGSKSSIIYAYLFSQ